MSTFEIPSMGAVELSRRIIQRELSPTEVACAFLERIDSLDGLLNSFLTVDRDQVLEEAKVAERVLLSGEDPGPLCGVPIAIKDLEDTCGLRTTYGCAAYRDHIPTEDSALVERLRHAGAVVLGKTNTPAFGLLGETKNRLGSDAVNPWNTTRTTGGSSGGSAASVAAQMAPLATGTDAAGSITAPSAMCGTFGIKPTLGLVPVYPNAGDSLAFNCPGPITRTVEDAAYLLQVMMGHDSRDPISLRGPKPDLLTALQLPLAGLRIAYSSDLGHFPVENEVSKMTAEAAQVFERLGCVVEESTPEMEDPWLSYLPIYLSDAEISISRFLSPGNDEVYPETRNEFKGSMDISGPEVSRAMYGRHVLSAVMVEFFQEYDLLLTPATATPSFPVRNPPGKIGGKTVSPGWMSFMPFSIPWNLTGQPTATVPCGLTEDGLPIGMLIVGRVRDELTILQASAAFEKARPWTYPENFS